MRLVQRLPPHGSAMSRPIAPPAKAHIGADARRARPGAFDAAGPDRGARIAPTRSRVQTSFNRLTTKDADHVQPL